MGPPRLFILATIISQLTVAVVERARDLTSERGGIASGLRADFIELDSDLNVHQVWVGGAQQR